MNKNVMFSQINSIMKRYGFKKKGNSWKMTNNSVTIVLGLQKSRYSNTFVFEMGICVDNSMDINHLKYYNCGITVRLNSIPEFYLSDIDKALNLEIDNINYLSAFIDFLDKQGMKFIINFFDVSYLQKIYRQGFFADKMIDNESVAILSGIDRE